MKREILPSSVGTGFLPFLNVALENKVAFLDEPYEIREVYETRNRAGWMIKTDVFSILLYKSSPITDPLISTCEELVDTNPSYALFAVPNNVTVEGFSLFVDEDETRMWTKSKKSNVLDVFQSRQIPEVARKRKAS